MLFDIEKDLIESEKERNLYCKFFAGYFFNECVPCLKNRLEGFLAYVNGLLKLKCLEPLEDKSFGIGSVHVSFDNHAYLAGEDCEDKGEFADVFIFDNVAKIMIAIEAKYLEDVKPDKDIDENIARLKFVEAKLGLKRVIPCLLITQRKHNNLKMTKDLPKSKQEEILGMDSKSLVLIWDDLVKICDDEKVIKYMNEMLRRRKDDFRIISA
jgi:hypothetical protein